MVNPDRSDIMTLVLDRYFVHRLRVVSGKDGNPAATAVQAWLEWPAGCPDRP
jgi:hypothetical protein